MRPATRPRPPIADQPTTRIAPPAIAPEALPTVRTTPVERPAPPSSDRPATDEPIGPLTVPAYELRPALRPGWSADTTRRRTWISRSVLAAILLVQALLSVRLANTAFEDEALYVAAGHIELAHLLHGTPVHLAFASYFSGAPTLYPVLAAAVDSVFGLIGVRLLSLLFMLVTTALLYSVTRRLFNERTALCAATAFSFTESTLVLGYFATYDAAALMLLAAATWIVVHTARRHLALCLLAAPVAALAVAVKYAAALFLPTIVLLLVLVAGQRHGLGRALARGALLSATTIGLLLGGLYVSGYANAVALTTTNRAHGTTPALTILAESVQWGGLPFAVACLGTVLYATRGRLSEVPGWQRTLPSTRWRLAVGVLLTGTALLAPLYQIHLATSVSLHKHVGYGLLFAAPMAGVGLTRIMGAHFRYPQLAITVGAAMLALGMTQSASIYAGWPDSTRLIEALRQQVTPTGRYLADTFEVPAYYLRSTVDYTRWSSTYTIDYTDKAGHHLTGIPGYRAAIDDGYFNVVVLDTQQASPISQAVLAEMRSRGNYRLLTVLPYVTAYGPGSYQIWHVTGG
jgi:4-amino-4-deoxy-L-arabinose transferase-like glycosyltransferase